MGRLLLPAASTSLRRLQLQPLRTAAAAAHAACAAVEEEDGDGRARAVDAADGGGGDLQRNHVMTSFLIKTQHFFEDTYDSTASNERITDQL